MTLLWRSLDSTPVRTLSDHLGSGGGRAVQAARRLTADEVISEIDAAGLRGRGGAGFPTATKLRTVAASRSERVGTTVVVNAAEGEPGTFKDRALLRTNPYRVLEGAVVAATAVGATRITVGIKGSFEREIQRLRAAIAEADAAGWFDGLTVEIVGGPSSYLFGEETAMLEVLEGRQPFPRVTPPFRRGLEQDDTRSAGGVELAAVGGSDEPPALVDNVETLANVALILANGAEWYRQVGTAKSPGTIVCTVSGATRRHGVGEIAMGTTLRRAIELIGWGPQPDRSISIVVSGTANALIPSDLLDTPLTYEAMREVGTGPGSAGFIVFDDRADPVAIAQGISRFLAVESCGQCEPCKRDGIALASALRDVARSSTTRRQLIDIERRVETVTVGARCNLALQQAEVIRSLLDLFRDAVSGHQNGRRTPAADVIIAPIADLTGGRAILDLDQLRKQPDWSTNAHDSGTSPAARLGDTAVHVETRPRTQRWSDWSADDIDDHPLSILDEAHDLIDRLLHDAVVSYAADRKAALDKLDHIVRVHLDVTTRILFPMARRYGGETGEDLADLAEQHHSVLAAALRRIRPADVDSWSTAVDDFVAELHHHADCERALVDALRLSMDPDERSSLADALGEARTTATLDPSVTDY